MPECVWIHYSRPRPHWYALGKDEQVRLAESWASVRGRSEAGGALRQGSYHIRGQHDFQDVEIWVFPDSQAAFAHWDGLCAERYNEFFAFANNLGLAKQGAGR